MTNPSEPTSTYSDESFWEKVKKYAKAAGMEVLEKALWLYYAAQKPETPKWAKAIIYGALAYFVFPLDAVPDLTPVVGYVDDLGALLSATGMVALYIDDGVKQKTADKLKEWFD
ncbi:MAG: DUF1232 domain-containing protein [Myxococcales bacterium]|nr:MAG: DUF1232 domain-containing protein [Myxococcales bacterium]